MLLRTTKRFFFPPSAAQFWEQFPLQYKHKWNCHILHCTTGIAVASAHILQVKFEYSSLVYCTTTRHWYRCQCCSFLHPDLNTQTLTGKKWQNRHFHSFDFLDIPAVGKMNGKSRPPLTLCCWLGLKQWRTWVCLASSLPPSAETNMFKVSDDRKSCPGWGRVSGPKDSLSKSPWTSEPKLNQPIYKEL